VNFLGTNERLRGVVVIIGFGVVEANNLRGLLLLPKRRFLVVVVSVVVVVVVTVVVGVSVVLVTDTVKVVSNASFVIFETWDKEASSVFVSSFTMLLTLISAASTASCISTSGAIVIMVSVVCAIGWDCSCLIVSRPFILSDMSSVGLIILLSTS